MVMASKPVRGSGPVDISISGKQYSFPLSAFVFDASGAVNINPQFPAIDASVQKALLDWVGYLAKQSLLTPGDTPAPQPALLIQARDPGSTGNFITVDIENVQVKAQIGDSTADVTVTETDTYAGLTPATLEQVIGKISGGGSRPGLVFLVSQPDKTILPAVSAGVRSGAKPYTFDFAGVFKVQAKHDDEDGKLTTVNVTAVDTNAKTFTLVATWTKSANAVKLSDLIDPNKTPFAYELAVTAPAGGLKSVPTAGVVTLSGGIDAQPAASAQATVVAAS
jgi:hypothetical protein